MQAKHLFIVIGLGFCGIFTGCPTRPPTTPPPSPSMSATGTAAASATQTQTGMVAHPFGTGSPPPAAGSPTDRAGMTTMFPNKPDRGSLPESGKTHISTGTSSDVIPH